MALGRSGTFVPAGGQEGERLSRDTSGNLVWVTQPAHAEAEVHAELSATGISWNILAGLSAGHLFVIDFEVGEV